ncbi:hypothetical protein C8J57DRAFT_1498987 [Mycena rebaudengoi]|nr:hypothetical protein C8J57DRAFT_1498987 [Mycena rebaudengoi]
MASPPATSGPEFYQARRARWLAPNPELPPRPHEHSSSRRKLEQVLSAPDAVNNDDVWFGSIEKIWKGLGAGGRLKRRLPMYLVIKIIHSAWLRDDTWPPGAVAPEPDDELPPNINHFDGADALNPHATYPSSGMTTPWLLVEDEDHASR